MEPLQMVSHGYQTLKGWQMLMISSVGPSGLIGNNEFLAGVPLRSTACLWSVARFGALILKSTNCIIKFRDGI